MRHIALSACALLTMACASSGPLTTNTTSAPIAVIPRWAEPAASLSSHRTVESFTVLGDVAPRETVRIEATPERDPVDVLLTSRRGRHRLRSFSLRDAPVGDTLRMFAEIGNFNVVMVDEVASQRVTISLRDVSLLAAFRAVLSVAHLGAAVVGGEVVEVRPARS